VPAGGSRLRLGVSAAHTDAQLDALVGAVAAVLGAGSDAVG
jgi:7-keto-8-aminopelargonate synthetase-like enzyme